MNPQFEIDLNDGDEEIKEYFRYVHNKILREVESNDTIYSIPRIRTGNV